MGKENNNIIPFNRSVRVGNYKLWRSRSNGIKQVIVSSLDGTWKVSIPENEPMYGTIVMWYGLDDADKREQLLTMLFGNFLSVTTLCSIHIHDAFSLLLQLREFPYIFLHEDDFKKRMKARLRESGMDRQHVKAHLAKLIGYRRKLYDKIEKKKADIIEDYERSLEKIRDKDEESMRQLEEDEKAMQMLGMVK